MGPDWKALTSYTFPSMSSYTYMAGSPHVNMVGRLKETPTKNSNKNINV